VAQLIPTGYAATLLTLWEFHKGLNEVIDGSLAYAIEQTFW
jgi:hypothetical protein